MLTIPYWFICIQSRVKVCMKQKLTKNIITGLFRVNLTKSLLQRMLSVKKVITSGAFIKKYRLASASSVQAALKGLLEKDFVTQEKGVYQIYDRFLGIWLKENY